MTQHLRSDIHTGPGVDLLECGLHYGLLSTLLVELENEVGGFPSGTTVEELLLALEEGIQARELHGTFDLKDTMADAVTIIPPPAGVAVMAYGHAVDFVADPNNPTIIETWADNGGSYPGWIKVRVFATATLRITSYRGSMADTVLAIWGPRETAPGPSDDPWHLSDDAYKHLPSVSGYPWNWKYTSSLQDIGHDVDNDVDFPSGTLYPPDGSASSASSADIYASGITLEPGLYWICVWPYDGDLWDTSEDHVILTIQAL